MKIKIKFVSDGKGEFLFFDGCFLWKYYEIK